MSKKTVKIIGVLTGTILSLIMLSGCKGPTKKEPSDLAPDTFPEDFSTTYDVMDGGFTYIEVLSGENRYFSGGYCVEEGKEPERESYKEISIVLYNIVTNAKKHPKKTN